ncbi:hypothetical protein KUTeg_013416 [Tegillarca granosa]|uniref:Uncharacterized protein n=1 Tax=Tegillarca granosa TaxID=220873 RepID=A0ABQ9ETN1_TEGGR|nr:hypothetical protein KUTeg_013416 [Tegillarca granosa]
MTEDETIIKDEDIYLKNQKSPQDSSHRSFNPSLGVFSLDSESTHEIHKGKESKTEHKQIDLNPTSTQISTDDVDISTYPAKTNQIAKENSKNDESNIQVASGTNDFLCIDRTDNNNDTMNVDISFCSAKAEHNATENNNNDEISEFSDDGDKDYFPSAESEMESENSIETNNERVEFDFLKQNHCIVQLEHNRNSNCIVQLEHNRNSNVSLNSELEVKNRMEDESEECNKDVFHTNEMVADSLSEHSTENLEIEQFQYSVDNADCSTEIPFQGMEKSIIMQQKTSLKLHSCLFCGMLYSKLPRHFEDVHQSEKKVIEALLLPKGSSERKQAFLYLQNKGDYNLFYLFFQPSDYETWGVYRIFVEHSSQDLMLHSPWTGWLYYINQQRSQKGKESKTEHKQIDLNPTSTQISTDDVDISTYPAKTNQIAKENSKNDESNIQVASGTNDFLCIDRTDNNNDTMNVDISFCSAKAEHNATENNNNDEISEFSDDGDKDYFPSAESEMESENSIETNNERVEFDFLKQNHCIVQLEHNRNSNCIVQLEHNRNSNVSLNSELEVKNRMEDESEECNKDVFHTNEMVADSLSEHSTENLEIEQFQYSVDNADCSTEIPFQGMEKSIIMQQKTSLKLHSCLFCGMLYSKLPRHFEDVHQSEKKVIEALLLPKGSSERKQAFLYLQNKGDYNHNISVLEKGHGILIPKYRSRDGEERNNMDYLPCEFCFGLYVKSDLAKHQKKCKKAVPKPKGKAKPILNARLLLPTRFGSKELHVDILNKMKDDEIK